MWYGLIFTVLFWVAGGPYITIATNITGTTYTDNDVTNETTYYYVVTAIINGSEGLNSNEASATPITLVDPNQPTDDNALLVITINPDLYDWEESQ